MQIEILKPELVQRLKARLETGFFQNADDLVEKALGAFDEKLFASSPAAAKNLMELSQPVRGLLTDDEVDTIFSRIPLITLPNDLA